ncbi:tyrosine-type recombinase/integrase [Ligilactobacillus saerimneri]|uniref:Tyrosine-type recombinase/integrase n=1 Tax=Ligilactobacillus saerimneri TaxID=228229 RepID=A0A7H9EK16_9LACO|nr:site-specific integrase [Ligilactobacillus saerimneri]QLL77739.1 tyrosine-type recombinase/integrase [Ligilactobacillus saerimneri]
MATFKKYTTKKGMLWRYQVCITDPLTGKKRFKSKSGFATKRDAKIAADELEKQIHTGGYSQDSDITFKELTDMWLESYQLTVRESTFRFSVANLKKHVLPLFGHKKIADITTLDCQRAVNRWSKEAVTFNKRMGLLQRILRYALSLQLIDRVPTDAVIMPRTKKADSSANFYTRDELRTFLEYAEKTLDYKYYAFFRLLAFSGLRKGEALALTWSDVNFKEKYVDVNKTTAVGLKSWYVLHPPKTEASIRKAYIDSKTVDVLKEWRSRQAKWLLSNGFNVLDKSQHVFTNQKNELWYSSSICHTANSLADEIGLHRITLHGFRHTYATLAAQGGMPIKELQAQLGHSNVKMTLDIYTSVTAEQRKETAGKYTAFVNF